MRDAVGRFQKGISGNPGGRPEGRGLKQEIERKLAERPEDTSETRLERIARILVSKAEEGDLRALELILKRLWPEKLEVESDSTPLVVIRDYTGRQHEVDRHPTVEIEPAQLAGGI